MNPGALLGILVAALALFGGGYKLGDYNATNACVAGQSKGVQAAQTAANSETDRREVVAAKRETSAESIRVIYKTIKGKSDENVKQNPAYSGCGLDADGLRVWNAANSGSAEDVRAEPYLSLHRAATGQVGAAGGLVAEPSRGDGAVQPMPGQAGTAGGVR